MSDKPSTIVWFRQDLRLTDNIALCEASAGGHRIVPLYILDDVTDGIRSTGAAARWWLHNSLEQLDRCLEAVGSRLILRSGPAKEVLRDLCQNNNISGIYWNRVYERAAIERDKDIKSYFRNKNYDVRTFNAGRLAEPWEVETKSGTPYRVYTPFWRACRQQLKEFELQSSPKTLKAPESWPQSEALTDWDLRPSEPDWASEFGKTWTPGELGAQSQLKEFVSTALERYTDSRDFPAIQGTSRLSPHLHFGEIGPRQVWNYVNAQFAPDDPNLDTFLSELGWREFTAHLLFHYPKMESDNLKEDFDAFPWRKDDDGLESWKRGRTGYPLVDAGMRELWQTGWMHNRVRMIVASFLVKDLLIDWREGESWFWDTLVDADLASNVANWQWVAGCGADAAPYFRIFNPITQSRKFDPEGKYIRSYIPELRHLPDECIHAPWEAPEHVLETAGVILGETYPAPIIDHKNARDRALEAFETIKK